MAITASVLPLLLERVNGTWPDNQHTADLEADVDVLNAIAENQTSRVDVIISNEKERDVKVTWLKTCPPTPDDCTDSCTFDGEEANTDSQTYALSKCLETEFKVNIDGWYNNEFEATDAVAQLVVSHMVGHANAAAQYAVGKINTFVGAHQYTNGGEWTLSNTDTLATIPADKWGTPMFGGLLRAAKKNHLMNPFLLSGEALDQEYFMATTSQANGEGKGDANRVGKLRTYFDLMNIEDVNDDDANLFVYMIARGALAFASKARYEARPTEITGRDAHTRFMVPNRFFPRLLHDVQRTTQCSGGATYEHWKIKTKFDVFRNPLGCTATQTGLLKFARPTGI